ncbi:MAG: hypothetical protein OXH92_05650 [Bryobacterales bacterium]|nr:hypothetical protein [Bryobacterales bacterium]
MNRSVFFKAVRHTQHDLVALAPTQQGSGQPAVDGDRFAPAPVDGHCRSGDLEIVLLARKGLNPLVNGRFRTTRPQRQETLKGGHAAPGGSVSDEFSSGHVSSGTKSRRPAVSGP